MNQLALDIGWKFWGKWTVATTVAWTVGFLAAIALSYLVVNPFYPKETNLIVGLCVGAAVGIAQMIAVRQWITLPRSWVWGAVATMAPLFIAKVIFDEIGTMDALLTNVLLGVISVTGGVIGGFLQARAIRSYSPHAGWWVLASLAAWGLTYFVGTMAGGVVLGAASGGMLVWFLRTPDTQ